MAQRTSLLLAPPGLLSRCGGSDCPHVPLLGHSARRRRGARDPAGRIAPPVVTRVASPFLAARVPLHRLRRSPALASGAAPYTA